MSGLFGSESGQQRRARRSIQDATSTLQNAQTQFGADPLFQGLRSRASQLTQDPYTYGPDDVARLQQQAAGTIHQGSKDFLDTGLSRLAGTGSGTRGGAAQGLVAESAARFAPALARQNFDIESRALEQRNADLVNMFNLVTNALQQQYSFPRDIAQSQLGGGQILGNLAMQPTPLSQAGRAFGGPFGASLGAASGGGGTDQK